MDWMVITGSVLGGFGLVGILAAHVIGYAADRRDARASTGPAQEQATPLRKAA
jgi:hypothetical protein